MKKRVLLLSLFVLLLSLLVLVAGLSVATTVAKAPAPPKVMIVSGTLLPTLAGNCQALEDNKTKRTFSWIGELPQGVKPGDRARVNGIADARPNPCQRGMQLKNVAVTPK